MLPSNPVVHCHPVEAVSWADFSAQNEPEHIVLRLFRIYLPAYENLLSYLSAWLDPTELARAQRYYQARDQRRFSICRALLKLLLAEKTGLHPGAIALSYYSSKKPYLASHPTVQFNISHAGDYAIFAFASTAVGIDIEKLQYSFQFQETLPHLFSEAEITAVQQAADQTATFYTQWTRKEALVKAAGKGIDDQLSQIPTTDGSHTIPLDLLGRTGGWHVHSFAVAEHYVGAVAYAETASTIGQLRFYTLPTTLSGLLQLTGSF